MASIKLIVLAVMAAIVVFANAQPMEFQYGGIEGPMHRVRREEAEVAASNAYPSSYGSNYQRPSVGPVYTFVKTDPKANFKWGVRHRVGAQYGRR